MASVAIAGVQMNCRLMDKPANLAAIAVGLKTAAQRGAKLAIFPECAVTGYCFTSKEEAWPSAETVPGPTTETLVRMCRDANISAVVGLLESDGGDLYNSNVLVGPNGLIGCYRKTHLPCLGVDRFTKPGSQPFAIHEVAGLRVGMLICYDSSFPEASRCLMLAGADLIALPTNWPLGARKTAQLIPATRALENHVYFAAINRIGVERGVEFLGASSIADPWGDILAHAVADEPTVLLAMIDPEVARNKHIVREPGEYELDRLNDRRPDLYGSMTRPK